MELVLAVGKVPFRAVCVVGYSLIGESGAIFLCGLRYRGGDAFDKLIG